MMVQRPKELTIIRGSKMEQNLATLDASTNSSSWIH
jgi:hypothetical protein